MTTNQEAQRLRASLRSLRAHDALVDAELLLKALAREDLVNAAAALHRIDAQLPQGALAGFVRVRVHSLASMIAAMQDDSPTPPAA
ncbi:hypothetical protein HOP61_17925 [Halomonas daqingensis]|uniref:Uncharacterized protein n=1 Tax=Billgrantia desiderata TaxID=52021 RepID=A0AAW4YY58_9GAMM|nr:hypothetical protein [Halomonas desiderata]MCE8053173.1 hypothetical protein [Halomonas desiderata]